MNEFEHHGPWSENLKQKLEQNAQEDTTAMSEFFLVFKMPTGKHQHSKEILSPGEKNKPF